LQAIYQPTQLPVSLYVSMVSCGSVLQILKTIQELLQVRLHTDKASGQSKGYAHVHFKNEESLEQAIGMTGHNLEGRNLKISYAQKKK
jgi:RNA recognition motif-containing protein